MTRAAIGLLLPTLVPSYISVFPVGYFSIDLKGQLQRTLGSTFTIERELGGGGMSRVFIAEEVSLGRKVVVKVLPPDLAAAVNVERFRREIQLVARLQHPHIVPVLAAGITDGLPYYTMPFIEGESLRARLTRTGELPIQEVVRILRDVLGALAHAHQHGVIHRDIKPDNIMLTGTHAVVADFGVAKALSDSTNSGNALTSAGIALGTPAYMAPEQAMADPATDHRADIYAVGAVAYEMLTGQQVFSARPPHAMIAAHAVEKPEPVDVRRTTVPAALSSMVMRALEKHPADRPQSANEMLAELDGAATPVGATAQTASARSASPPSLRLIVAAIALAVVGIAVALYAFGFRRTAAQVAADDRLSASSEAIRTVAVIPFANTGGDPQDEYFSDGMTDELAHALSRLGPVSVAGRSSSYSFKGKSVPAPEIGRALNVSAVIEGSVRRAGQRLRVIAQLISTKDGRVVWSDSFQSDAGDVFQVQDNFTQAIVAALSPALGTRSGDNAVETSRGTDNLAAYDFYLKGRFYFAKRGTTALEQSIKYFQQALVRDSKFARAQAGLSMATGVLTAYGTASPATKSEALRSAQLAVGMDSTLGDAHLALANALSGMDRFADAEPEYERALTLQPRDATTHEWHGDNLLMLARVNEAVAEEKRASALDPLSPIITHEVAYVLFSARQFEEGITWGKRALALDSNLMIVKPILAAQYVFTGRADTAVQILEGVYASNPGQPGLIGLLAFSYAAAGRWSDFRKFYDDHIRNTSNTSALVFAHLSIGDRRTAAELFERSVRNGLGQIAFGCMPTFDPLKTEPRFLAVMRRSGAGVCPARAPWPIKAPPPNFTLGND